MATTALDRTVISGPRILKPYEVRRLLALPDKRTRLGKRDAALLAILATGGLRVGECAKLRLDNVEAAGNGRLVLRFPTSKRKVPEYRAIVLPPGASKLVQAWIDHAQSPLWLFTGQRGEHLSVDGAQKIVTRYLAVLGRTDLRTHALRHSFGSAITAERGIHAASKLLGHKSIDVTSRYYASFDLQDALAASDALAGAMTRRAPGNNYKRNLTGKVPKKL